MGGIPFAAPPYRRGDEGISRLLLEQGRIAADRAQQSGAIWGNAVQQLGQQASGALQQHQMAKRDAAVDAAISSWDGQDPKALYASLKALDPRSRMEVTRGMVAFMQLGQKDEAQERENWAASVKGAAALPFPVFAKNWATIKERLGPGAAKYVGVTELPEQADEETYQMARQLAGQLGGVKPEEGFTLGPGQQRFDPSGRSIASVAPEPPKPPSLQHVETAEGIRTFNPQTGEMGPVIGRPRPRAADIPKPVDPNVASDEAKMLLTGGTADKIPIRGRAAAVAAAKASGGVDGTGFVPMNNQQQTKYQDFMDLRSKALRLRELMADDEVASSLGPGMGRYVDFTKELPMLGASTKVKEAFDLFKDLSDAELRKRSGAAISPGEYARITGFTVAPVKQKDSNLTNLNRMIGVLENSLRTIGADRLPASVEGGPKRISSDADYDALPSGAQFIGPDGKLRQKP